MYPIKEDVDARLPLERATNVFWIRTVPHEGSFVPSSPVRISHAHSLDMRGRRDRRRIQRHTSPQ